MSEIYQGIANNHPVPSRRHSCSKENCLIFHMLPYKLLIWAGPIAHFWMTTFQILANSQYTKLWWVLTVKVGEMSLPNPWLSSVTTLSNITDTICLTVAAAVVQIVASFMKYNLKHKTMALGVKQKKLVRLHEPFSCQRLSGQSWTWTELNRTELNTLFKHDGVLSRAGGVVYVEINK